MAMRIRQNLANLLLLLASYVQSAVKGKAKERIQDFCHKAVVTEAGRECTAYLRFVRSGNIDLLSPDSHPREFSFLQNKRKQLWRFRAAEPFDLCCHLRQMGKDDGDNFIQSFIDLEDKFFFLMYRELDVTRCDDGHQLTMKEGLSVFDLFLKNASACNLCWDRASGCAHIKDVVRSGYALQEKQWLNKVA